MKDANPKSTWHGVMPPLDHVPFTPTQRKYVRRGLKRGLIAAAGFGATIGIIALFLLAMVAIAVFGVFWWLLRTLATNWQWLIVLAAAAYIAAIIFTTHH